MRHLWTSRSVAKSVVSVLVGMAIKEGMIGAVKDPVTRYLPELNGSAWENVTLRELLQHTSGVTWNENYADPVLGIRAADLLRSQLPRRIRAFGI